MLLNKNYLDFKSQVESTYRKNTNVKTLLTPEKIILLLL